MMTAIPVPIRVITLYLAVLCLGFGALCWIAPHLLFSSEGYRTVARGIIGSFGALLLGTGASLMWSVVQGRSERMIAILQALVLALAGAPAVAFYNMGALEPLRVATGVDLFMFLGMVLLLALAPACLALFALLNHTRYRGMIVAEAPVRMPVPPAGSAP